MGNASNRRDGANNRSVLSRHPLAVACAAAFMLAANASYAQDTAATGTSAEQTDAAKAAAKRKAEGEKAKELESVKVVGIRRGIENAIEAKQTATGIVESVSAEDIGKLPDSSIAESIARLPGLTAQRERGRAAQVNIRGFAGDFAGTTLNGREQTTTGDNRGVEFDQYPSELLGSVVVYKTPDASLVGQGLSGTVDLKTARPLEFADRVISGNFRFDQNENRGQKGYGNRYSFAYIDQFADRTIGVAIGLAHLDSPTSGFQNEAWGYADGPNGTKVFGGGKTYKFDNSNKRDGIMATLQYKPNDFYESTIDAFYSKFKKTEVKTGVEFGTAWGSGTLQPGYTVAGNSTIVNSTWTGVKPVLRMDSNPSDDTIKSFGWNNKWTFADNWTVNADLSYSKSKHAFRVLETYAGITANNGATTLAVDLDPSGDFNNYTFGADLNDPSSLRLIDAGGWGQDGYLKDFEITDKLNAFRLDATRTFDEGAISSVRFGFNRTDRSKSKSSIEAKLCIVACLTNNSAPFPGTAGTFGIGGIDGLAFYDANALLESGFYNLVYKFDKDIANKNWKVDEKVDTFFAQANIDTDVHGMALRGNFGFQYVRTDQSSEGFNTFTGNAAGSPVKNGIKYNNFLPSLNMSLEAQPDLYVRFAVARQIARPRMDQMRASFDVSIQPTCGNLNTVGYDWCGGGGNPQLKPWLANAYDISLEKYFTTEAGNKGYVAAAFFFKDLQTWISNADRPYDFAGYDLPAPSGEQSYPLSTVGNMNQPFNGEGGLLKGTEFTVSLPLDFIWGKLNGFGFQGSYSDTKSSVPLFGVSQALPGLSKYVSNVTAYYEHAGFSARVSQRKRSHFVQESRGFGADLSYTNANGETVQDVQFNYAFPDSSYLKGLSLYLQVSNIGDEPATTSDGGDPANRPVQYFEYGKNTLLGFSYKF